VILALGDHRLYKKITMGRAETIREVLEAVVY
jgi:hypothetical protein